jgi:predicted nucleic acid-binding protein
LDEFLFVDTSFLVARFNPKDKDHLKADRFMGALAARELPPYKLVTSEYVFDETVTTIYSGTKRHDMAVTAGNVLRGSRTMKLMAVERPVIEGAWQMFKERPDKRWSFTDCVSFTLMEAMSIRAGLSFDSNFKEAGFAMFP